MLIVEAVGEGALQRGHRSGSLIRLIERLANAGVKVELEVRGERPDLAPGIDLAAFRIVQEALTNVVKHSGAPRCNVTVSYLGDALSVEITDEGRRYVADNQAALDSAMARMEMAARAVSDDAPPRDLHHAMHTLKAALMFHRGGWDEEETERVRKIIGGADA